MRRRRRRHPLRVQLERLQRGFPTGPQDDKRFRVDSTLAVAIWEICEQIRPLDRNEFLNRIGGTLDQLLPEEIEELQRLRARRAAKLQEVGVVEGYTYQQYDKDTDRLVELRKEGRPLSLAEQYEAAQLCALVEAFSESPEVEGRRRISDLSNKYYYPDGIMPAADQDRKELLKNMWPGERTPAEHEELEALRALYPDLPRKPLTEEQKRWEAHCKKMAAMYRTKDPDFEAQETIAAAERARRRAERSRQK
jgi:hypothetical protein